MGGLPPGAARRRFQRRIEQGEFVAIVGPSGSGKSTLLQMLGALDHPSAGALKYRGSVKAPLAERADPPPRTAPHEIGFIFQAFHLLPTFTAIENVQIPMFETRHARAVSERKQRSRRFAESRRTRNAASHHFPAGLSGGRTSARRHRPQPRQRRAGRCWPTNPRAISTAKTPT